MRVRLKTIYAGPLGCFDAGAVAELPTDQAEGLLAAGYAEAVAELAPEVPPTPTTNIVELEASAAIATEPEPAPKSAKRGKA